jgi:hypothetical protein
MKNLEINRIDDKDEEIADILIFPGHEQVCCLLVRYS